MLLLRGRVLRVVVVGCVVFGCVLFWREFCDALFGVCEVVEADLSDAVEEARHVEGHFQEELELFERRERAEAHDLDARVGLVEPQRGAKVLGHLYPYSISRFV